MEEIIYKIAKFSAVICAIFATGATLAIVWPYRNRHWYLKLHLGFTGASQLILIWLTVGGFALHIWANYPVVASLVSNFAYILFFTGIWFSHKYRATNND